MESRSVDHVRPMCQIRAFKGRTQIYIFSFPLTLVMLAVVGSEGVVHFNFS